MFLVELFKYFGINIYDVNIPNNVLLALCFMLLIIFSVLCFINILIYFFVLYIFENKSILERIEKIDKVIIRKIILKLINFYKKSSILFIVFEILIFFVGKLNNILFLL
jgi:hypothetical protein